MTEQPIELPEFDEPPVVEVVFGVRYKTAEPLRIHHVGLYRELIKDKFPGLQEQAPLPAGEEGGLRLTAGPPPLPRCWFLDESENTLIQLQPDRFMHNWRKVTGLEPYPRYEAIREAFLERWEQFVAFVENQALGSPGVLECALTYVNHIPKDTCWAKPGDLPGIFTPLAGVPRLSVSDSLETVSFNACFALTKGLGQLHVNIAPAVRTQDQKDIVRFDLTAARSGDITSETMMDWFDSAREAIVTAFVELTTEHAHGYWKMRGTS